jgi:hypothetical protein
MLTAWLMIAIQKFVCESRIFLEDPADPADLIAGYLNCCGNLRRSAKQSAQSAGNCVSPE